MPMHFLFRPLPRVTGTPPWLLRPMRVSTSFELYPDTRLFFVFLNAQASSFLIQTHLRVTYGTPCRVRGHSRAHTCDLRDAMPRQRSLYIDPPPFLPREAEDFLRGDKHFKHVPPPIYLICLSPKELYRKVLFKLYDRPNL